MYILYYINICSFISSNHYHQFWGPIRRTNYFTQVMKDLIKLCLECYKVVTLLMLSVVISIQRPPICGDRWLRCYLCEELLDLLDSPAPDLLAGGEAGGDTHLTSWTSPASSPATFRLLRGVRSELWALCDCSCTVYTGPPSHITLCCRSHSHTTSPPCHHLRMTGDTCWTVLTHHCHSYTYTGRTEGRIILVWLWVTGRHSHLSLTHSPGREDQLTSPT